jgi:hypothetical protein
VVIMSSKIRRSCGGNQISGLVWLRRCNLP